jgi:hypothetical protein
VDFIRLAQGSLVIIEICQLVSRCEYFNSNLTCKLIASFWLLDYSILISYFEQTSRWTTTYFFVFRKLLFPLATLIQELPTQHGYVDYNIEKRDGTTTDADYLASVKGVGETKEPLNRLVAQYVSRFTDKLEFE